MPGAGPGHDIRGLHGRRGLRRAAASIGALLLLIASSAATQTTAPIFNGRDRSGWHVSATSHHGQTQAWRVENGILTAGQEPKGRGGILLTDRRYGDVEITLDVWIDRGCDSGLLLRSSEDGAAYQVTIDDLDGGNVGSVFGERLETLTAPANPAWVKVWRRGDWNTLRARIEGAVPRIRVWLNGTLLTDWTDTANHAAGGAVDGAIGLQVHGGARWIDGGRVRFRNLTAAVLK